MINLLPCPFCGEQKISFNPKLGHRRASINCPACLVAMPDEAGEEELRRAWNERAGVLPSEVQTNYAQRGEIADAIREYCHSVSPAAVQNSHGVERIYYSGISVDGLTDAVFAILGRAQISPGRLGCRRCGGWGRIPGSMPTEVLCTLCNGSGALTVDQIANIVSDYYDEDEAGRYRQCAQHIADSIQGVAQAVPDPFNRKRVEAVCRAVCVVEGVDPDDDVFGDGCDAQWTRYADAVASALAAPSSPAIDSAQAVQEPTAVERFQKRVVEMVRDGCVGFHFSSGPKWHGLTIEEKCAAMLEVWDAKGVPLDFKDSRRTSSPPSASRETTKTRAKAPRIESVSCEHAAIIGLDGMWHCQKCGDAIEMATAQSSAQGSSPKERGNRFCKHDDCPYPDCLVEGVCPSQSAEDVAK